MPAATTSPPPGTEARRQRVLAEALRFWRANEDEWYLQTRNFTLGGHAPAELVVTEDGGRQVMTELSAQEHDGPLWRNHRRRHFTEPWIGGALRGMPALLD